MLSMLGKCVIDSHLKTQFLFTYLFIKIKVNGDGSILSNIKTQAAKHWEEDREEKSLGI